MSYRQAQEQQEEQEWKLLNAIKDDFDRVFGREVKLIRENDFKDFVQSHENDAKH